MKERPFIFVLGSLNADFALRVDALPKPGESRVGTSYEQGLGGKGANQAVAASKLGARVAMAGKVGADIYGDRWIAALEAAGVDARYVLRSSTVPTGMAWIIIEPSAQNRIVTFPGANRDFAAGELERLRDPLREADLLLLQMEMDLAATEAAVRMAAAHGVPVMLNPGPVGRGHLSPELYALIDCMTPNETEAEALTGIAVRSIPDAERAALKLLELGVRRVALTLGEQGAVLADSDGTRRIAAFKAEAVDTVAAGDTFTGALAVSLCRGFGFDEAARFASAAAAIAVTRHGAMNSIPELDEVNRLLGDA